MAIDIINDVELNAILPLQEILRRARSGEIPKKFLVPLLIGRYRRFAGRQLRTSLVALYRRGNRRLVSGRSCALKRAQSTKPPSVPGPLARPPCALDPAATIPPAPVK